MSDTGPEILVYLAANLIANTATNGLGSTFAFAINQGAITTAVFASNIGEMSLIVGSDANFLAKAGANLISSGTSAVTDSVGMLIGRLKI